MSNEFKAWVKADTLEDLFKELRTSFSTEDKVEIRKDNSSSIAFSQLNEKKKVRTDLSCDATMIKIVGEKSFVTTTGNILKLKNFKSLIKFSSPDIIEIAFDGGDALMELKEGDSNVIDGTLHIGKFTIDSQFTDSEEFNPPFLKTGEEARRGFTDNVVRLIDEKIGANLEPFQRYVLTKIALAENFPNHAKKFDIHFEITIKFYPGADGISRIRNRKYDPRLRIKFEEGLSEFDGNDDAYKCYLRKLDILGRLGPRNKIPPEFIWGMPDWSFALEKMLRRDAIDDMIVLEIKFDKNDHFLNEINKFRKENNELFHYC